MVRDLYTKTMSLRTQVQGFLDRTLFPFRSFPRRSIRIRLNHTQTRPPVPPNTPASSPTLRKYLPLPLLRDLSKRTGVPIPSLGLSFLVLHEITAVIPVIGLYFIFDAIGAGQSLVGLIRQTAASTSYRGEEAGSAAGGQREAGRWSEMVGSWYNEGEKRVEKVGRKYGFWGFEKGSKRDESEDLALQASRGTERAAEGIANAISAYVAVKVRSNLGSALTCRRCCPSV